MVAIVAACVSILGAVLAGVVAYWTQLRTQRIAHLNRMSSYKDSLLWASFDLQSRLYNILDGLEQSARPNMGQGFIQAFLIEGTERQVRYARYSTAFVFAEYMGWAEIFRRDIQFLDLGKNDLNRKTVLLLADISGIISSSGFYNSINMSRIHVFRIFRTTQRAIGELMIAMGSLPGEWRCIGYAEFCRKLDQDDEFRGWIEEIIEHIDKFARSPEEGINRLISLQHKLIELIELLDPKGQRFPSQKRKLFRTSAGTL